jgi:hypothetical protein
MFNGLDYVDNANLTVQKSNSSILMPRNNIHKTANNITDEEEEKKWIHLMDNHVSKLLFGLT